jgi:xylulose-5-phosphate/fructose-6-phosphate phosphoketolase
MKMMTRDDIQTEVGWTMASAIRRPALSTMHSRAEVKPSASTIHRMAIAWLSVFDHCMRSRNYVNIVTCGKQPQLQWLNMDEALEQCSRGASTWKFATNDDGGEPDVVMACAGDVPTIETCAAAWLLQKHVPGIKVRVVDVVDLTALMMPDNHPHGMDNMSFNALFTEQAPVMFAFHNNRWSLPRAGLHGPRNHHHAV